MSAPHNNTQASAPRGLLSTRGLSLRFGGVVAADGIDFDLMPGERLAVVGQNGAGKTTFINICTGYLKPDSGQVMFDGTDITGQSPRVITRRGIGRSFQLPQVFTEHTVRECLLIAASAVHPKEGLWRPMARAACRARRRVRAIMRSPGPRCSLEWSVIGPMLSVTAWSCKPMLSMPE